MPDEYEFFPPQHAGYSRSEVTHEGLAAIKSSDLDLEDKVNALFTVTGYKNGAELHYTAGTDDEDVTDEAYDLVTALTEMGVACLLHEDELSFDADPGFTPQIFRQEYRILATRDLTYGREGLKQVQEEREETGRIFPEFLGYPEQDIDAYIEQAETPAHRRDQQQVLTPYNAANKYELSQPETDTLIATTFHMVTDNPATLETRLQTAETRQQVVEAIDEAYDVDFTSMLDARATNIRETHEQYNI